MHFWIDKRSSYGIGHNRPGMVGLYNQPRRMRSKSFAIPRPVPSTSSSHVKSNNHRSRHTEPNLAARALHQSTSEQPNTIQVNPQHVPVIHPVFPRDDIPIEIINERGNTLSIINYWLPIQIIGAICMILAIGLVMLKLHYDNNMTGWQIWYLASITFLLILSVTAFSVLRMLKHRSHRGSQNRQDVNGITIEPTLHNQASLQSCDGSEPPPPYHEVVNIRCNDVVAINLSEKSIGFNEHSSTPPPSYEKVNMA